MKKPINTRLHGILDYSAGFILLLPWLTDYHARGTDTIVLGALGLTTVLFSLFTDYEWGLVKLIPMKVHLFLDVLSALLLMALPWLFPLQHYLFYWPVLFGLAELGIIVLSSATPYRYTREDVQIHKH